MVLGLRRRASNIATPQKTSSHSLDDTDTPLNATPSATGSQAGSAVDTFTGLPGSVNAKDTPLNLRVNVISGRNLAPKDRNGMSDPFLVITLGDARQSTPIITKTLNPTWHTTFDFPVYPGGVPLLECICWDKDRFGKDYMGEFDIPLEDIFDAGKARAEPRWFELVSRRRRRGRAGKKGRFHTHGARGGMLHDVSGEIQLGFEVRDPRDEGVSEEEVHNRFKNYVMGMGGDEEVDDGGEDIGIDEVYDEDEDLDDEELEPSLEDEDEDDDMDYEDLVTGTTSLASHNSSDRLDDESSRPPL
ncbi:hypothetical protein KEM55_007419 [Ascosphaera atra]|nr:hypothetical protein KEM55_007419 [Ascosphaera atra]